ncbi:hypothetical protein F4776DRAFT_178689 [Hypoxylon sp. NC0597]|nr:hypothetical protein F4776DRAFT_178689 [Hypoxylon sp. NC0597]
MMQWVAVLLNPGSLLRCTDSEPAADKTCCCTWLAPDPCRWCKLWPRLVDSCQQKFWAWFRGLKGTSCQARQGMPEVPRDPEAREGKSPSHEPQSRLVSIPSERPTRPLRYETSAHEKKIPKTVHRLVGLISLHITS